ncbi:MAG: chloride channel protein [Clostridiales bacterium]|nr:chloride channel protein [Clostridiales bacterium]
MSTLKNKFSRSVLSTLIFGCITGIAVGVIITLFLLCAKVIFSFSARLYSAADTPLVIVCILILALLCCFLTAVIQYLCPSAKGSGIPLAEGAARGMLRVKWLRSAAALVAGSLLAFLAGMPLGSEGPSVGVGGLIGDGIGKAAKKPTEFRRYLITGGSCAGLAVAFNAPLTGLCFAFEETHRRFSAYILAAAFSAVITGTLVSQAMLFGFSHIPYLKELGVSAGSAALGFLQPALPDAINMLKLCGIAALCGIACAAMGVGFNRAIEALGKQFSKIKAPFLRLLPAFILAAAFGLVLHLSVGSGEHALINISEKSAFTMLFTLLVMRLLSTVTASASGSTGGLFIPMLSLGGIFGFMAAKICIMCGMDAAYAPNIVLICISAFFAAVTRAPITAILLSVELSASFAGLLPCVTAVAVAAVLTDFTKTEPLYEHMLENMRDRAPLPVGAKNITAVGAIPVGSPIADKRVRNILWPYNSLVTGLKRGENELVPDGETILREGDVLTVRAENVDPAVFYSQIDEYITTDEKHDPPTDSSFSATARNT